MKKNTKLIVLTTVLLSLILGFFYFLKDLEHIYSRNNVANMQIEKIFLQTISNELDDFSKDKINEISIEIINLVKKVKDKETLSKANFILGYIDFINSKYEESIEKYNNSISYFEKNKNPKMKAKVYYELSRGYLKLKQYNLSQEAFQRSLEICEQEYTEEEKVLLNTMRSYDLCEIPSKIHDAVKIMEDNLELAKKIKYENLEDVYLNLGIVYWYDQKEILSINCKLEALEIASTKKRTDKIISISTEIGIDHLLTQNYKESIKYLEKSLEYNTSDYELKSYILLNLSEAYIKVKQYNVANNYIKELETYISKQKKGNYKEDTITYMYLNKAELEINTGNTEKGMYYLDLASDRFYNSRGFNFYDFEVKLLEGYGDVYYIRKEYTKALDYHKEAQSISKTRDLFYYEDTYNEKVYLDYKALGNYEEAIKYLEKSNESKKEAKNNQDMQYSQYLLEKFEVEQNLKKISKLEQSKTKMFILFLILILMTIFIAMVTFFIHKKNIETNKLNKLFKDLSETDCLTKVPNRRALEEYLKNNWNKYQKTHMPISFIMIDIDYFKKYNDNYGHIQGDIVLEKVAQCIEKSCRKSDFLARYGGEEFTLIMTNTGKKQVMSLIEGIMKSIYELDIKHEKSNISDRITLSIGITTAKSSSKKHYMSYIEKSDEALYEAKIKGRNTYVFLD